MATAPQIDLRDGSGDTAQAVEFSTNQDFVSLTGMVTTNTVDLQVAINSSTFVSDPTLVKLDGANFTVPNPDLMPDGIPLDSGINTIQLRAIDISGGVSAPSTAQVSRITLDRNVEDLIPTGVRLRRRRDSVQILCTQQSTASVGDQPDDLEFRGFNFYASTAPGGTTGYYKVNRTPVTDIDTIEEDFYPLDGGEIETTWSPTGNYIRIEVTEVDEFGVELHRHVDSTLNARMVESDLKFTSELTGITRTDFAAFIHNRNGGSNIINSDLFLGVPDSDPLYYVVAGVYYDPVVNVEFESPYSQELVGKPHVIDTAIRDLPGRRQIDVVVDYVDAVQRVNTEIALIPGSTTRDVSIDPFASEVERIWFLLDFVHRSQSFLTLLQIDDVNNDGVSDPVRNSAYKQALKAALGYTNDQAVQNLIDTQFEKLASNFDKARLSGRAAIGEVVFYTATRPVEDKTIATGTVVSTDSDNGTASRFIVGGTFVMLAANADAYYNFDTQRYEIVADVVAESPGSAGNRPANTIKNVQGDVGGLSVTNTEATVFGRNRESNHDLAIRAQLGFSSVDTGTEGGYLETSANQVGVIKSKVVKSGDPLMMRDWDPIRVKHIGGKVDVWVQGLKERTVTDTFAFTFDIARDIRCDIIDVANLTFRVQDSRVTEDTPIIEILDNLTQGLGVRNVTAAANYDLSGVTILDYNTFQLNTSIPQPTTAIDDVITADYRFRSINQFIFTLQPVRRVISVVGETSGALDPLLGYDLYKTDDPLLDGESTIAQNYLVINQVGGIPSGDTVPVNDETHVLIGFFEEPLASVGINTATLRIFNEERTVEYNGPDATVPDYDIVGGTPTTPIRVVRTNDSQIVSGETVSVDYEHDENFVVTYVVNDLLQELQATFNQQRHITADVLAKQAVENELVLETSVQLNPGAKKDKADPAIRSNVSVELNSRTIGQGVAQSDVIQSIDATEGVDFQVLPLAKMGYSDGSVKLREGVRTDYERVTSLDIGGNRAFILTDALDYPTTDGGGLVTEHKGVFQDDRAMTLSSTFTTVALTAPGAFIIGADGAIINGYTDDVTLIADGFTDPEEIKAERVRRTANHVLVALAGSVDVPTDHDYAASYVVRNDSGPHDLVASQVEFVSQGPFTITIRETS